MEDSAQQVRQTHLARVDEVDDVQARLAIRLGEAVLAGAEAVRFDLDELCERRFPLRILGRVFEERNLLRRHRLRRSWQDRLGRQLLEEIAVERLDEGGVGDRLGGVVLVVDQAERGD